VIVEGHTPTGSSRGVSLNRGGVMDRIHLEIVNDPHRTPTKVYAQVNLDDGAARKLRDELNALLGEGGGK
jgi:hypothetical protein